MKHANCSIAMIARDATTPPDCAPTRTYRVGTLTTGSPPLTRGMKTALDTVTLDLEELAAAGVEHLGEEDDVELSAAALHAPSQIQAKMQISLLRRVSRPIFSHRFNSISLYKLLDATSPLSIDTYTKPLSH